MTDLSTTARPVYDDPLLENLRAALLAHFDAPGRRPDAVDFRITEEHDTIEGLAWAGDGALLLYGDRTVAAGDLTEAVGDDLDAYSLFRAPSFGDTLVIALSAGFVPAPGASGEQEEAGTDGLPAFDPQDAERLFASFDDRALDRIEQALTTERVERLHNALTVAVVAALPELAAEEPFESTAPVGRVVFGTEWDENGTHFSCEGTAQHTDGTVTRWLEFSGDAYDALSSLTDLTYPGEGDQCIVTVPGVTMLVDPCTVCNDKDCQFKEGHASVTCVVCPEPYSTEHAAHPLPGCPGFTPLSARPPALA
ncbi:hypothetical protein [Streptomyces yaizuensis]|uniref:Uncharacterized protein n=1 Tax=Streptomyces yaizuensis TaxID=2989713 RepID=A0ABQ5P6N1_9ACTN|nr:hypothetical protein [Streptomyces sp. YSPA8]GLF98214.1 hypothetical protein SYYSPA8_27975 [Streptomyces sp. YSPA8]